MCGCGWLCSYHAAIHTISHRPTEARQAGRASMQPFSLAVSLYSATHCPVWLCSLQQQATGVIEPIAFIIRKNAKDRCWLLRNCYFLLLRHKKVNSHFNVRTNKMLACSPQKYQARSRLMCLELEIHLRFPVFSTTSTVALSRKRRERVLCGCCWKKTTTLLSAVCATIIE